MFDTNRFVLGLAIGALLTAAIIQSTKAPSTNVHDEFHIHADFIMAVNDERVDLSDEKYMSGVGQIMHENVHLHDQNPDVIHVHAEGITLATFLDSIGFTLTGDCLTLDTGDQYCSNDQAQLALYVNGNEVDSPTTYIMADEDQILLYYGEQTPENVQSYVSQISADACIYSLTCPEKGMPPPESCGLTCEI